MPTPLTQAYKDREETEIAIFWDEMSQYLPKSLEREALGDAKIFRAFKAAYPKIKVRG